MSHAPDSLALVLAVEDEASLVDYEKGELVPHSRCTLICRLYMADDGADAIPVGNIRTLCST